MIFIKFKKWKITARKKEERGSKGTFCVHILKWKRKFLNLYIKNLYIILKFIFLLYSATIE